MIIGSASKLVGESKVQEFDWREELGQIFGAIVRQQTLESGAEEMAAMARSCPDLHATYLEVLSNGIQAAHGGDTSICSSVERSGYYAPQPEDAEELIRELQRLYRERYAEG